MGTINTTPACAWTWLILVFLIHLGSCPCSEHIQGLFPCKTMFCFCLLYFLFCFCYYCMTLCMCPVGCAGGCCVCARYDTAKPVTGGALRLEVSTPCFCYVSYCFLLVQGKKMCMCVLPYILCYVFFMMCFIECCCGLC